MDKYPFVKCLHPRRIQNKYTGEWLVVPCGKCEACLTVKNSRYSLLCDLESQFHKYTMFITLTYAPRYLPMMEFVETGDFETSVDAKFLGYDSKTSEVIIDPYCCDRFKFTNLLAKFNLDGKVPYLRKTDLQLWFKRFRKICGKYSKDKVRYFAVGEYGPQHFRPHYHVLLWFEDDAIYEACEQIVRQTWTYGRVDVQKSQGNCSSYVASYVNSSVFVPDLLTVHECRPFCVHSRFLGRQILENLRKDVYQLSATDFVQQCVKIGDKSRDFTLPRSFYAAYYPKCEGFASFDDYQLYRAYTIYEVAKRRYELYSETTFDIAKNIFRDLNNAHLNCSPICEDSFIKQSDREFFQFFDYYWPGFSIDEQSPSEKLDLAECAIRNIYKCLLLSKHFLEFVCDGSTDYFFRMARIHRIKDFYSELDYARLQSFFQSQQLWYESDLLGEDFVPFFYDNTDVDWNTGLIECKLYRSFCFERKKLFEDRVKHKKLNDINRLLFN